VRKPAKRKQPRIIPLFTSTGLKDLIRFRYTTRNIDNVMKKRKKIKALGDM
jgi:hypothetical protein